MNMHGCTPEKNKHPLYIVWSGIKQRCSNPNHKNYAGYGGRGIFVSEEWVCNAAAFIKWAIDNGWEYGLEIDRVDNDGPYSAENCRVATHRDNILNSSKVRKLSAFGETKSMSQWAEDDRCAVGYSSLRSRLHKGWSVESAITMPNLGMGGWRPR